MYFSLAINASAVPVTPSTVVVKKVQTVHPAKAAVQTNATGIGHRYAADLMPTASTKVSYMISVKLSLFQIYTVKLEPGGLVILYFV